MIPFGPHSHIYPGRAGAFCMHSGEASVSSDEVSVRGRGGGQGMCSAGAFRQTLGEGSKSLALSNCILVTISFKAGHPVHIQRPYPCKYIECRLTQREIKRGAEAEVGRPVVKSVGFGAWGRV